MLTMQDYASGKRIYTHNNSCVNLAELEGFFILSFFSNFLGSCFTILFEFKKKNNFKKSKFSELELEIWEQNLQPPKFCRFPLLPVIKDTTVGTSCELVGKRWNKSLFEMLLS